MKIVFSRKGFDSAAGGNASMIFPDGTLFSIPIPSSEDELSYSDLSFEYKGEPIQKILSDLTNNRIHSENNWGPCNYFNGSQKCHYDPMRMKRHGFDGIALGQTGPAEGHLRNQGVSEDDVFLFYGWFKSISKSKVNDKWCYLDKDWDVHLIWSYMVIGDSPYLDTHEQQDEALKKYPFLEEHPHTGNGEMGTTSYRNGNNRIYLSKAKDWDVFAFDPKRCLTDLKEFENRSKWRLPSCFNQRQAWTYLNNFELRGDEVIITYRGPGQEFVLNLDAVDTNCNRERIEDYVKQLTS